MKLPEAPDTDREHRWRALSDDERVAALLTLDTARRQYGLALAAMLGRGATEALLLAIERFLRAERPSSGPLG